MRGINAGDFKVSSVGLRVTFVREGDQKTAKSRSFELAWPNSCSLADDDYSHRIQQMLADHGIEPKIPVDQGEDGNSGR